MKATPLIITLAAILVAIAILSLARLSQPHHPLVGCWEGSDSTVVIFRDDGSFIGRDYLGRRIWGHWSALNSRQIGFQALYHTGSYAPEYAEITPEGMRYACPDNAGFIGCVPLDYETASRKIALSTLNQARGE